MNNKKLLYEKLNSKINLMLKFIDENLISRNGVNKKLVVEFRNVLIKYKKSRILDDLYEITKINSRPSQEGEATDFTTGISLSIDGNYTTLMNIIMDIEDLISALRKEH